MNSNNKPSLTLTEEGILELIKKLKFANYNAYENIPFLAQEIAAQLRFIRPYLRYHEQIKLHEKFQKELEQRQQACQVTYEWWIIFAYRMSTLITPAQFRNGARVSDISRVDLFANKLIENNLWHTHEDFVHLMSGDGDPIKDEIIRVIEPLQHLIKKFPDVIMIPSVMGDVPIRTFNRALIYNAIPLGIVINGINADGQFFYPDRFFRHELVHAENWFFLDDGAYKQNAVQLFIEYILNKINNETDKKQQSQLEFMLFVMTHEFIRLFPFIDKYNFKARILNLEYEQPFYELCSMDSWYALLIKPYLPGRKAFSEEVIEYANESILLMEKHILKFFDLHKISNFLTDITKERNYKIKYPLTENEISNHWTASNEGAKKLLVIWFGTEYSSATFYHYLVKKDKVGPKSQDQVMTHLYLADKKREFNKKIVYSDHMKMFKNHVKHNEGLKQASDVPDKSFKQRQVRSAP